MADEFEMTDLGRLTYYLGIEVKQQENCTELKEEAYAKKLLERSGMVECKTAKYPMETKFELDKDENGKEVNSTQFKSIMGSLRY